ncbi:uncharacterized protein LOC143019857 [Oratosquilla oratoria]|uniref:uncharacterized protein LOC143019857 n=1 Tax=Oratosquilla oratoria TaxID=337810 RepID=UPI003F76C051
MALLGIRRYRTASYHPQANGMVERFHRQLKVARYAHALNNELLSVALSLVLLGIRTSIKVNIGHSPAELVFGTTLRLPDEFVAGVSHSNSCTLHDFTFQLKETMAKLHPLPPRHVKSPRSFVSQDLLQYTHVFVRTDTVRKALQPPYEGPFEVLRRTRKTVIIRRNGKCDHISIDWVKLAHLFDPTDTPVNVKIVYYEPEALCFMGTIGNVLCTFLVDTGTKMKILSQSIYPQVTPTPSTDHTLQEP